MSAAAALFVALLFFVPLGLTLAAGGPQTGVATLISSSSSGAQGNLSSTEASTSADGQYVAFSSDATNLIGSDANGSRDVFVKDTRTGTTILASADAYGTQSNGFSYGPSISADGRYVAFVSTATNLTGADTYGKSQVYIKDLLSGAVQLVSASAANYAGNDYSISPAIAADGRYVAFESAASNLVGGDANGANDVFVKDTQSGGIQLVTRNGVGVQADKGGYSPAISADGRYVSFVSPSHLVNGADGVTEQVYRKDTMSQTIAVASSSSAGVLGNGDSYDPSNPPSISPDGHLVAFVSGATNLVSGDTNGTADIFTKDFQSGTTTRINTDSQNRQTAGVASRPDISGGGRFVAFSSPASDLVYGDYNNANDIFVKDLLTGWVSLVSRGLSGAPGNGDSINPSVSTDGHYVSFESTAADLAAGDTNGTSDVFQTPTSHSYYWSWYDQGAVNHKDWVLMANPAAAATDVYMDLLIGGLKKELTPLRGSACPAPRTDCAPGQVPPGQTVYSSYNGVVTGPVEADSENLDRVITSQRSLWGSSLEELPGTEENRLSDHYYWTWYDESPGYNNWIIISNPNPYPVYYRIKIAGQNLGQGRTGSIAAGQNKTPDFPGIMGGPVEVLAWSDQVDGIAPANVIASQRVLSGGGSAFNEVPGVPATQLFDHYLWTWYDDRIAAGAYDWVMVANPNSAQVYYQIEVGKDGCAASPPANTACKKGTLASYSVPGSEAMPDFPGVINGPVSVQAWTDGYNGNSPAKIIASQRSLWGPSFEEVPGTQSASLGSDYHWTWYDQDSAGALNWVMISNPADASADVYYDIYVGGALRESDRYGGQAGKPIPPGGNVEAQFNKIIGGPVEVKTWADAGHHTPAPAVASQRVLWNGYFNEVLGTQLN